MGLSSVGLKEGVEVCGLWLIVCMSFCSFFFLFLAGGIWYGMWTCVLCGCDEVEIDCEGLGGGCCCELLVVN